MSGGLQITWTGPTSDHPVHPIHLVIQNTPYKRIHPMINWLSNNWFQQAFLNFKGHLIYKTEKAEVMFKMTKNMCAPQPFRSITMFNSCLFLYLYFIFAMFHHHVDSCLYFNKSGRCHFSPLSSDEGLSPKIPPNRLLWKPPNFLTKKIEDILPACQFG